MIEKALTKKEIIKEISEVTNLKPDMVKSVIDAFSDIFIREVVMKGNFTLVNCFSVKTHKRKARRQYDVSTGEYKDYPETEVLSMNLAKNIKSYHRWKNKHEYAEERGLPVENWAD